MFKKFLAYFLLAFILIRIWPTIKNIICFYQNFSFCGAPIYLDKFPVLETILVIVIAIIHFWLLVALLKAKNQKNQRIILSLLMPGWILSLFVYHLLSNENGNTDRLALIAIALFIPLFYLYWGKNNKVTR